MPELPEVETVVRTLRAKITGAYIDKIDLHRTDILSPLGTDLTRLARGHAIASVTRRGKKIVFQLDDGNQFYIHLGMSGRLTIESPQAQYRPHTHLVFTCGENEVRFVDPRRFGGIWWLGLTQEADEGMGPEPLSIRPSQLARRLSRTTRAIKNALLDQSVIAGLGNIYVDESLFSAGIHPLSRADQLTTQQIAKLNRSIKATLRQALQHRGSTLRDYRDANGQSGNFQKLHRVYDREGKPCGQCKTPIERIVLGGRSTHFCAKCQR